MSVQNDDKKDVRCGKQVRTMSLVQESRSNIASTQPQSAGELFLPPFTSKAALVMFSASLAGNAEATFSGIQSAKVGEETHGRMRNDFTRTAQERQLVIGISG